MSFLAPQTFASALFSLIRLGFVARNQFVEDQIERAEVKLTLTKIKTAAATGAISVKDPTHPDAIRWLAGAAEDLQLLADGRLGSGIFEMKGSAVLRLQGGGVRLIPGQESRLDALSRFCLARRAELAAIEAANIGPAILVWTQDDWLKKRSSSPLGRFAESLLDVSLDFVAKSPELLGGGRQAKALFAALVPNIAAAYVPGETQGTPSERLAAVFAQAALSTLAENPQLIAGELRWQTLITGVLEPLQEEVKANGANALFAEDRIRDLLQGPMGRAALTTISANPDLFLKGGAASGKLGGIVARATLGQLASVSPEGFRLRDIFGQTGFDALLSSVLAAASAHPGLFIRAGKDGAKETEIALSREFLTQFADVLAAAPAPFRPTDAMAIEAMQIALEVTGKHLLARIEKDAGKATQNQMGAAIAAYLLRDIFDGFKTVAGGQPFDRLGQSAATDLLRLVATYVARSPDFLVGKGANPAVKSFAASIAGFVLADEQGLLTAEDWRAVIAATLNAALENPGALFGAKGQHDIAGVLILRLMKQAADNFRLPADKPGRILFGATLREALIVTIDTASSGLLASFATREALDAHLEGVDALVVRLNGLAASQNRKLTIGSREWLKIYARYVALALEDGKPEISKLTDAELAGFIRDLPGVALPSGGTG